MDTITSYFGYEFVRNAFIAGTMSAILGAVVGYFVVLRNVNFAAHALSHIGFTGAAAAGLFGWNPLQGILLFTVAAGLGIGVTGDRLQRSDMSIGMVLSMSLGLGVLFLSLYNNSAAKPMTILFGDPLGVSREQIAEMAGLSLVSLALLALIARRLLFASIQPRLAEARGLSLPSLSIVFMVVLAFSVSLTSQIVGILLVFTLIIAPAGVALRLCRSFWRGILTSIGVGVAGVWAGLLLALVTDWPPTFWITAIFFVVYLAAEGWCRVVRRD